MAERRCLDGDTVRPCPVAGLETTIEQYNVAVAKLSAVIDDVNERHNALLAENKRLRAALMARIAEGLRGRSGR